MRSRLKERPSEPPSSESELVDEEVPANERDETLTTPPNTSLLRSRLGFDNSISRPNRKSLMADAL